ncbi:MAG: PEP-CTERM sorting domain-containing protein [Bythopirellula sp.]|nr:PEP-CTERM sorting domain-containing protein [Bythopirellula sp.]
MKTNSNQQLMNYVMWSVALLTTVVSQANADPLPLRDQLKFSQEPMLNTTIPGPNGTVGIYHGHDELSTLYSSSPPGTAFTQYSGTAMADDFADAFSSPVLHVKWWGSYMNNTLNPNNAIKKFLIAFESDIPADQNPAGNFSTPGQVLSSQIVTAGALSPGSGTFTETLKLGVPAPGEDIYEYNAELHLGKEFFQKPETVYWLKIAALVDNVNPTVAPVQWGWHNRDYTIMDPLAAAVTPPVLPGERDERIELGIPYPTPVWHFQDDSVSAQTRIGVDAMMPNMPTLVEQFGYIPQRYLPGFDGPGAFPLPDGTVQPGIGAFSKDLAFQLFTYAVPEPNSCILFALGLMGLVARRR